jgi:hypothetical protein
MRLAALLAELPEDVLERLALEHLGRDEAVTRAALCATLEGVLRSYSFVRRFVANRLPPTFTIFECLLDSEGFSHPAATFREAVVDRLRALGDRVAAGDLVGRDESLRIYRRVLIEARRNDLQLDGSEMAILSVLRRELGIRTVEHFLVEHHGDFQPFWSRDRGFLDETNALRSCGMIFGHDGNIVLAAELVPLVRQALGLEMSSESRNRLFSLFSASDLAEVLRQLSLKTSGNRDDKLSRLLSSYVQPSEVLRLLSLQGLREMCRQVNAASSGSKDELVERLVDHFLHSLDLRPPAVAAPDPPVPEARELDATQFGALFGALRGDDLTDILSDIDSSRVTGAKETKVALLAASPFAEATLLGKLTNKALEETLLRLRLRAAGSKSERVARLIDAHRAASVSVVSAERDGARLATESESSVAVSTTATSSRPVMP